MSEGRTHHIMKPPSLFGSSPHRVRLIGGYSAQTDREKRIGSSFFFSFFLNSKLLPKKSGNGNEGREGRLGGSQGRGKKSRAGFLTASI